MSLIPYVQALALKAAVFLVYKNVDLESACTLNQFTVKAIREIDTALFLRENADSIDTSNHK